MFGNCEWGGVQRGGFSAIAGELGFFAKRSVFAREFLLEFDTSLAVATSGWRTTLLLQEHPPLNPNCPELLSTTETPKITIVLQCVGCSPNEQGPFAAGNKLLARESTVTHLLCRLWSSLSKESDVAFA